MAKERTTRKELLKNEDEFITLSSRVIQYFSAHRKQIEYAITGLIAVGVIAFGANLYWKHVNKKAAAAYASAYQNFVSTFAANQEEDYTAKAVEDLNNLIEKYSRTKIAAVAEAQLAFLKFNEGNYDEAISHYEAFMKKQEAGSLYHTIAHFGLAVAYEAKGDREAAISQVQEIADDTSDPFRAEAIFLIGRLYAESGQAAKSREIFTEFVETFKNSSLVPMAKTYLKN